MKKYIERLTAEKTPHERRTLSLQIASVAVMLLFVAWVTTLGTRLALHNANVANQAQSENTAATLNAVSK